VRNAKIPVYLIQPPNDASLDPSRVLGPELTKANSLAKVSVFPPNQNPDLNTHCFGGAQGVGVWSQDALDFITRYIGGH
jgi:hypothetical protein